MSESEETGKNQSEDATPAEVVEVVGKTGMHGEAMQVKARVLGGNDQGRILRGTLSDRYVRATY